MAITKVRGFNRGKTYDDLRAIAGGPSVVPNLANAGLFAHPGYGTPWNSTHTGSLHRSWTATDTSSYPGATAGNSERVVYLEDMGSLADYAASGGFAVSMKVKWEGMSWQALGSDGTNFICAYSSALSATTPDLVNYQALNNSSSGPNVGYSNGRVSFANNRILAATGTTYATLGDAPGGNWTTLTFGSAQQNMSANGIVFRNGQYYVYGYTNGLGGAVWRTADETWTLTGGTMVYAAGNTINAIEHMDWFDDVGCFLGACTRNRASAQAQAGIVKSVDGTTWTDAFVSTTSTTGLMSVATNGSGTAVAVGYNGFIVTSTDGTATTWTQVSSGQTNQRFTSVRWFNGEFVAITQGGGTSTSPDGLIWTWVEQPQTYAVSAAIGFEQFIHQGNLYAYKRGVGINQQVVVRYSDSGTWEIIQFLFTSITNVSTVTIPAGIFFSDAPNATGLLLNSSNMAGINMFSTGAYVCQSSSSAMWTVNEQAAPGPRDNDWHRISIVGTTVAGQPVPTFNISVYYDGNLVSGPSGNRAAANANQRLWLCSSSGTWNMICDVIATDFSGSRNVGLTGDVQIRPRALTTDVEAQWEKIPAGAASNAAAAQGNGSVLYANSYVQSSATTDTDVYAGDTLSTIPGYKIAAVNVTASFQRLGIPTPTVELSVTEGGSSLPAQSTTLTGSTAENVSLVALYPTKLDGGSWTPETVTTANVQIKRTA